MAVRAAALAAVLAGVVTLAGCGSPRQEAAFAIRPAASPTPSAVATTEAPPPPPPSPPPKPKATLKTTAPAGSDTGSHPTGTAPDGVPAIGAGTFSVGSGGTGVVGTGVTLVKYRIEVEDGITWGASQVWTADSFAAAADAVLADPRGWIASAQTPVTDAAQHMSGASWSFQRVAGDDYSVRVLLAA